MQADFCSLEHRGETSKVPKLLQMSAGGVTGIKNMKVISELSRGSAV